MSRTSWLRKRRTDSKPAIAKSLDRSSRRRPLLLERLEDRSLLSAMPLSTPLAQPDAATQAQVSAAYGQLPLSFEAHASQADAQVDYLSRGSGYTLLLTPGEAVLSLAAGTSNDVVRMHIVGADPNAPSAGLEAQTGRTSYLVGSDPSQWQTQIANYGKVEYQNVYSGIDLVYYGNQRRLEYDFVVAPGADPNAIRLAFDGVRNMELDAGGNLILHTAGGDLVKDAPVVYQEIDGARSSIAGRYVLDSGQVRFEVGHYDHTRPLVIDPILSYSTYLGGTGDDRGFGIAVDGAGNAYVTGYTNATNFPTASFPGTNPLQPATAGSSDVFVTKLNSTGTGLVYSTYLGGSNSEWGLGIALDNAGNAYITGWTYSTDFPTTLNAYDRSIGGTKDAFVTKLNSSGSALLYSTFLGGSGGEEGQGIAVDSSGNAYVTGWTGAAVLAADFPTTAGAFQWASNGSVDGFVTKVNATGSALEYSTYLGGTSYDSAYGIAVDNLGSAYVTGSTKSLDFPLKYAYQTTNLGGGSSGMDAFVTKLNPTGTGLVYSTYLGGNSDDAGHAIAVDTGTGESYGEAYVLGSTGSTNFPVVNAYQSTPGGGGDAFVTRLSATGSSLVYSTYLGGSGWDGGNSGNHHAGIAVDASHNAYVTGFTESTNFPTKNPLPGQTALQFYDDAFVTKIDTSLAGAASLVFSTYLGGSDSEEGYAIAVDGSGSVYVTGETQSIQAKNGRGGFPVTTGAFQSRKTKGDDIHTYEAFVTKISFGAAPANTSTASPSATTVNSASSSGGTSHDLALLAIIDESEALLVGAKKRK